MTLAVGFDSVSKPSACKLLIYLTIVKSWRMLAQTIGASTQKYMYLPIATVRVRVAVSVITTS